MPKDVSSLLSGPPLEDWPHNILLIWNADGHPGNVGRMRLFCFFVSNEITRAVDVAYVLKERWPGKLDKAAEQHIRWLEEGYSRRKPEVMKLYTFNVINGETTNLRGQLVRGNGIPLPQSEQWIEHRDYKGRLIAKNKPAGAPNEWWSNPKRWRQATEEDVEDAPWFEK